MKNPDTENCQDMEKLLLGLHAQVEEGYRLGKKASLPSGYRNIRRIVFCGMGGSAIGGDIAKELMAEKGRIPFTVCRRDSLPSPLGPETLAVFTSYSGNTRETCRALEQARRSRSKICVITSGGECAGKAARNGYACIRVPAGLPPRCAMGYLSFSLIGLLVRGKWLSLSGKAVSEVAASLGKPPRRRAARIAAELKNRFVVLYGPSQPLSPVIRRWRSQLSENAKALASHHLLPELFHNEVEGWQVSRALARHLAVIFLLNGTESPEDIKKIRFFEKMLRGRGVRTLEVREKGDSLLASMFSLIYLGDWVSYELALLNRVNPLEIPVITRLKQLS